VSIDYIVQATKGVPLPLRPHAAKEALQKYLLIALQKEGLLVDTAFIGGTALRLLHGLPRYSEDLDFICTKNESEGAVAQWDKALLRAFQKLGTTSDVTTAYKKKDDAKVSKRGCSITVYTTSPAFADFSARGIQISFDIDLDPPQHTEREDKVISLGTNPVVIPSLTLPSLMAGKLHILLTRPDREKGRDWFDYIWYREKNVLPNVLMLNSAIAQTANGPEARYWTSYIRERAKTIQWINVRGDVKQFLEDPDASNSLSDVKVNHITPYPNFEEITKELHKLKKNHPLVAYKNPVIADIYQAAFEGDTDAMETRDTITSLEVREPNPPISREK